MFNLFNFLFFFMNANQGLKEKNELSQSVTNKLIRLFFFIVTSVIKVKENTEISPPDLGWFFVKNNQVIMIKKTYLVSLIINLNKIHCLNLI